MIALVVRFVRWGFGLDGPLTPFGEACRDLARTFRASWRWLG